MILHQPFLKHVHNLTTMLAQGMLAQMFNSLIAELRVIASKLVEVTNVELKCKYQHGASRRHIFLACIDQTSAQ